MPKLWWRGGTLWQRFRKRVEEEWFLLRLTYWSLVYNSLTSWGTVLDTALEPMFWFVDHFVRYLGPAFVVVVVVLVTSVVTIFYVCLLPEYYSYSLFWTIYHLVVGHWLLINVIFHYFKAAFTSPGSPPEEVPNVVSICKKCIGPKPPRSHHCSICDSCILKMDHHCPWLNNCVGHHNHRYFFLFCIYMFLGTVYVSLCAYAPFKEHFFGTKNASFATFFYQLYLAKDAITTKKHTNSSNSHHGLRLPHTPAPRDTKGFYFHNFIIYEFMLCSAVSIALGLLSLWHIRLIHKAETSIEVHINRKERNRLKAQGLAYRNPYSFGAWENWKRFLGITHGRTFWRHVLLPSSHKPDGDGLEFEMSTNIDAGLLLL